MVQACRWTPRPWVELTDAWLFGVVGDVLAVGCSRRHGRRSSWDRVASLRMVTVTGAHIEVDGVEVELVYKSIKRLRLSVRPPRGEVRVSAPIGTDPQFVVRLVRELIDWIRTHQRRIQELQRHGSPLMITGERLYVWGRQYQLVIVERPGRAEVTLDAGHLVLRVPVGTTADRTRRLLDGWYRIELQRAIPSVLRVWEPVVGAGATSWGIRRMRTQWGSCNVATGKIWLNLELARKDPESLEHVVVHELTHLLERGHGPRFKQLLGQAMPDWRARQRRLNASVVHPDIWELP